MRTVTREHVLHRLRMATDSGRALLACGAANGLVAAAAEAGGADLIVVYSSGKFRAAGRSSLSALMPYGNANEIVLAMLPEIRTALGDCPVVAALCGTDPTTSLEALVRAAAERGASGVQNFPTIGMFGHEFREDLEATGISFEQEIELLRAARRADLLTCGYVTNEEDAAAMALAGVDVIVPLLGVTRYRNGDDAVADAAARISALADAALAVRDDLLLLFHGGPVAEPSQVQRCLKLVPALHGYIAASSVERTPVARAVSAAARAFVEVRRAAGEHPIAEASPDFSTPPPDLPLELTADTLAEYLAKKGIVAAADNVEVDELSGGLSNVVLRWRSSGQSGVIKQSRPRLRVAEEWRADVRRIVNEYEAISYLAPRVHRGRLPTITFTDPTLLAFGMEEVSADARLWKPELLAGTIHEERAQQAGALLADIHNATRDEPTLRRRFLAEPLLTQNRLDPWYRAAARCHPDLAASFEYAISRLLEVKQVLVHGDFVPKNLFLLEGELFVVDFEVTHFGNPGYDVATFVNHMMLKGFALPEHRQAFGRLASTMWESYRNLWDGDQAVVQQEALVQLGALMLARVDGKSKVEYLAGTEHAAEARDFGRWLLRNRPASVGEVLTRYAGHL
ncbi:MAG: putative TIM-barrel enzyme a dioxygenase [Acidimicrobiaceae bacterium]|nr:putative TIM-barrel enzyme a dioxygenase [Acidimicrobiaceae bacterium]